MKSPLLKPLAYGVAIILAAVIGYSSWPREDYTTQIVMTSAANLAVGAPVWINGFDAGSVMGIETRDGKAIVTAGIAPRHVPLHTGTKARVQWYAALGERILTLDPGPAANPEIPDGGLFEAESQQVEVDQVLAALDKPTRDNLNGLIRSVDGVAKGQEKNIQASLQTAGPAVQATGAILEAVGRDGPAIRKLVTELQDIIEVTAKQQGDVRNTINGLNKFSGNVAVTQRQLGEVIAELPATLTEANATLKAIPPAVTPTNEMLDDLRPATAQLPDVAEDLAPLMRDLRPVLDDLRPTLKHTGDLLDRTPSMLDSINDVFPQLGDFLHGYQPAISYLRPYVPEAVGWLQNWGKNFSAYDSQGHMWAAVLGEGTPQAFNESPVKVPPLERKALPKPGDVIDQPWDDPDKPTLDANGSPVQ